MTAGSRLVLSLLQFVPTKGCSVSSLILSLIYFQIGVVFESRCSLLAKPKSYSVEGIGNRILFPKLCSTWKEIEIGLRKLVDRLVVEHSGTGAFS